MKRWHLEAVIIVLLTLHALTIGAALGFRAAMTKLDPFVELLEKIDKLKDRPRLIPW